MDNTKPAAEDSFYWANGFKLRKRKFGKKPVSERFAVPSDLADPQRPPFTLHWEDAPEGLSAVVAENDAGRMIANIEAKGNAKFTALAVGLVGTAEYQNAAKTIPFERTSATDGHGTADLGPLTDLAKRLGDSWVLVVFPVL